MPQATALPGIVDVRVYTETCDEWYGPCATFKWESPLEGLPDDFDWNARIPFREHAVACVLQHPAWAAFFEKPHVVAVDESGSDYTPRTVTVHRPSRHDNFEVSMNRDGGEVWALDR